MKSQIGLSLLALNQLFALAKAHYGFSKIVYPVAPATSINNSDWQYIRYWDNGNRNNLTDLGYYDHEGIHNPIYAQKPNFNSSDMRCNVNATLAAPGVLDVKAGTELGFVVDTILAGAGIYHQGPLLGYMARVPEGESLRGWDGSGRVWFKVYEDFPSWVVKTYGPISEGGSPVTYGKVTWPNEEVPILKLPVPASLPNGEYLFRLESMALHFANPTIANRLGVQFYISCAQIRVSGGVESVLGGAIEGMGEEYLTEFPGAYSLDDPILNVFWSNQTEESYKKEPYMTRTPGPRVWKG